MNLIFAEIPFYFKTQIRCKQRSYNDLMIVSRAQSYMQMTVNSVHAEILARKKKLLKISIFKKGFSFVKTDFVYQWTLLENN